MKTQKVINEISHINVGCSDNKRTRPLKKSQMVYVQEYVKVTLSLNNRTNGSVLRMGFEVRTAVTSKVQSSGL
jgi:hypothetical protein